VNKAGQRALYWCDRLCRGSSG